MAPGSKVYELRTYRAMPGKIEELHARFRNHAMRLFEKNGIGVVGFFMPVEGEHADDTVIYILSHDSREGARENWKKFNADPEWLGVRAETEANGRLTQKELRDSTYLAATDYSPFR